MADVIVVGAGHNGLTAACYLARQGLDVLVLEGADWIGGMTHTAPVIPEAPDHLINTCALGMLMIRDSPVPVELDLARYGYEEREIDPAYVYVTPDGESLPLWRDHRRLADEIRRFSVRDAEAYLDLARTMTAAMQMARPLMKTHPTRPEPKALLAAAGHGLRRPRVLPEVARICAASAVEILEERFTHPIVRAPFALLSNTAGDITAPSSGTSLIIVGLLHALGEGRLVGGAGALPRALERCLVAAGGTVRTGARVAELLVTGGNVTGVRLESGEELRARAVLSSADPHTTLTRLLPAGTLSDRLAARARRIPTNLGNVGFVCSHYALSGQLEVPLLQSRRSDIDFRLSTLLVGTVDDAIKAKEAALAGRIYDDVPFMASIPTAFDPSQAPPGQDTVYLWIDSAPTKGEACAHIDPAQVVKAAEANLSRYYPALKDLEIGRSIDTPATVEARTGATDGNWCHVDMHLLRTGPLRPALGFAGYRTPVPNLYLTGAGTHPSPAVSGMPGRLAARTLLNDLKRT